MLEHPKLPDDLLRWMEQTRQRLEQHLENEHPGQGWRELADMSQQFFNLSKGFLEMGNLALKALQETQRRAAAEPKGPDPTPDR